MATPQITARVIALAGRRIDAPGAAVRFPPEEASAVRDHLRELFTEEGAVALVSSAACGADLLALQAGRDLGMRRRVVLPFARERFRETSVVDRPGDWGPTFDQIMDEVAAAGDLVVLQNTRDDDALYAAASAVILDEAQKIAGPSPNEEVLAVIVWDGQSRGENDLTAGFARLAQERGLRVRQVLTAGRR